MPTRVAIIYNEPAPGHYGSMGEEKAVLGVLDEVAAVNKTLIELGYSVYPLPLCPPLEEVRERLKRLEVGLVFNLFEGFSLQPDSEARVAFMLAELGLPFTGSPGEALALDKVKAKALMKESGIPTPAYQLLTAETISEFHLNYPCIVKPSSEHASHGLSDESVVYYFTSLTKQVTKISHLFQGPVMVEEFLEGREFNATILGVDEVSVLPPSEIMYTLPPSTPKILTFAAKWEPESIYYQGTQVKCPAEIGDSERKNLAKTVGKAFKVFHCRGYARVDMRLDSKGQLNVIEVNPNPDLSPDAGVARQAKAAGMTYNQLIDKIIRFALEGK